MSSALQPTDYLGEVEQTLSATLVDGTPNGEQPGDMMMTAARHLCIGGGGKRIRPLLVHHFGTALGVMPGRLVEVGAAAELVHSASLLHDDVVDSGMFRRGRPTVNSLWGNAVAVMTGDMMLTLALQRLAALDIRLTQDALGCVAEMTRGTIAELEARGDLDLPVERMRMIAEAKTGALFAFCGVGAARVAGEQDALRPFDEFGRRLGIAFQIADDVKDLTGADEGKPRYADLASRTPSLPVLLAAKRDPAVKRRILEAWSFGATAPERLGELGAAVVATGALEESVARMKEELHRAREVFGPYASTPGGAQLLFWAGQLEAAFDARGDDEGHPVDGAKARREHRAG